MNTRTFETVTVVGLGYIGLPTAAVLASAGVRVHGMDVSPRTVEAISSGAVPFVEPGLAEYVEEAVRAGRLTASHTVEPADAYVLAVPTPFHEDRSPDLTYVVAATESIAPTVAAGSLVVLESTSPPGTTELVARRLSELRPDLVTDGALDVHVAHCPERVLPGYVMKEIVSNDRVVGGLTPAAAEAARDLYRLFCVGEILLTDATTAEMAKLVENSFRDVNIAFANELSLICDKLGVDVWELIELANHHPRVNILRPGPGVGGHCIAVDPWFIVAADPEGSRLIRTAREVNDSKPEWVLDKVAGAIEGVEAPVVAALGLAFKPNIDDLRESPARRIVAELADRHPGATVRVVEPHVEALPAELANRRNVELTDLARAIDGADCVVVLVAHDAFTGTELAGASGHVLDTTGLLA
ncbi:UDP-N-acetyl-D-mannosamine dehydrogenase [Luteimicrobium sp. NPDC057192]|uniref:UDP-N-acetyl-D-mannosamine dehydrogenase n=1 Tax=Luteimicrobium sp. NPDC057192 TaxID=3346042 RepID=UPI003635E762